LLQEKEVSRARKGNESIDELEEGLAEKIGESERSSVKLLAKMAECMP